MRILSFLQWLALDLLAREVRQDIFVFKKLGIVFVNQRVESCFYFCLILIVFILNGPWTHSEILKYLQESYSGLPRVHKLFLPFFSGRCTPIISSRYCYHCIVQLLRGKWNTRIQLHIHYLFRYTNCFSAFSSLIVYQRSFQMPLFMLPYSLFNVQWGYL